MKTWVIAFATGLLTLALHSLVAPLVEAQPSSTTFGHTVEGPIPSSRATRQWVMEYDGGGFHSYIGVVDTTGVCLYVTFHGIAAVPKTQLPQGAGCQ